MMVRRVLDGLAPVAAGVVLGLAVLAPVATATRMSDEVRQCGGESNTIEADIQLDAARDVWKILPALGKSPELEVDDRPARLIVFSGEFDSSAIGFATKVPARLSQVICVVQADGTVNLYVNVARNGSPFSG